MPTVLRVGPYRFFFYAGDWDEAQHIHVERDSKIAKVWLDPIRLERSGGFNRTEIGHILKIITQHQRRLLGRHGMAISANKIEVPSAEKVTITEDTLRVDLSDGRTISVPLAWFPRLLQSSPQERNNWRLIGKGHGIHWEDLDEDVSVEGLLAGKPSGEGQASFKKWLDKRSARLSKRSSRRVERVVEIDR